MLYEDESVVCWLFTFMTKLLSNSALEPYARGSYPIRFNLQLPVVCQDINCTDWRPKVFSFANIMLQILFLNKIDLFAEKLPNSPLGDYFEDFTGGDSYDMACEYLLHRFVSLNQNAATKQIYAHYTCATDTNQIKCMLFLISMWQFADPYAFLSQSSSVPFKTFFFSFTCENAVFFDSCHAALFSCPRFSSLFLFRFYTKCDSLRSYNVRDICAEPCTLREMTVHCEVCYQVVGFGDMFSCVISFRGFCTFHFFTCFPRTFSYYSFSVVYIIIITAHKHTVLADEHSSDGWPFVEIEAIKLSISIIQMLRLPRWMACSL